MKTNQPGHFVLSGALSLVLSACNGVYLTSPSHPYDWATAETVGAASAASAAHPADANQVLSTKCGEDLPRSAMLAQHALSKVLCVDMVSLTQWENDYYASNDESQKRNDRDRWVQTLMRDIDVLWWGYKNAFLSNDDIARVTSDTLVTGMAAGAAGVTAAAGKTALAVLAATLNGFTSSFDKTVLANQLAPVLFASIEADRNNIETSIMHGLKQPPDNYSLVMASRDVMKYADAGSLSNALASLSSQTGGNVAASKQHRLTASDANSGPPAPTYLRASVNVKGNTISVTFVAPASPQSNLILGYRFTVKSTQAEPGSGATPSVFYYYVPQSKKSPAVLSKLPAGTYTVTAASLGWRGYGPDSTATDPVTIPAPH